ncbi:hypothetical protein [Kineosporia babensis]|uniref:Uncharacterized protein n=1 Tax=Kineosporia babensis TaxID=499548 RepID=A0A9X1T2L7_9ACTN|nr:hypothetical protein [Kineosporia babensis]MCD5314758.1 hypothetical protein [Kineosporia babensis]
MPAASAPSKAGQIQIDRKVDFTVQVSDASDARLTTEATTLRPKTNADDRVLILHGITSEKSFLATEDSADPLDGAGSTLNSFTRIGRWTESEGFEASARTGRESKGVLAGSERQVTALTQVDDRLVWIESPSTDILFMEWSLWTAGVDGSAARELAHSQVLKGAARPLPVTGGTYPVVIGEYVYWAATVATTTTPDPQAEKDWEFNVLRTRLSGKGKVETVAKNAVMPARAGGDLIYAAQEERASDTYEIHRKAVSGDGRDEILVRGSRVGTSDIVEVASSEAYLAWAVRSPEIGDEGWNSKESQPGQIFVMDLDTTEVTTVITADDVGGSGKLSLTRTGVLWGNGSGNGDPTEYYLNMATKRLFWFAKNRGNSSVEGDPAHDFVMWTKGSDPKTHRSLWHLAQLNTSS